MAKDKSISIRVSADWLVAVDEAAHRMSTDTGIPVSRNSFIELAVGTYIATRFPDAVED